MQKIVRLEDVTYVANGNVRVRLNMLPAGKRVREIDLFFDLAGAKGATDALDGQSFAQIVSNIKISRFVNISGLDLQQLQHQVWGRIIQDPTDIPGTGTTFDMEFHLRIPFRDPRQPASDDGSIPTEMLMGHTIEITFAAATIHGVGTLSVNSGTVRTHCEMVEESNIPQLNEIGYEDPGSLTVDLAPGVYKDLFIRDGAAVGTITRAEITSIDLDVDGQPVLNNCLHEQLVGQYNSQIKDSAAEIADNAAVRLPLIWHDNFGKANISKQPAIEKSGRLQITGSITAGNVRCVYWRALEKDKSAVERIAVKTGAPVSTASDYVPATVSKTVPKSFNRSVTMGRTTKKARLLNNVLPGKFRSAKSFGAKK